MPDLKKGTVPVSIVCTTFGDLKTVIWEKKLGKSKKS